MVPNLIAAYLTLDEVNYHGESRRFIMHDIDREISENYGFEIKSIAPYKDAFKINTSNGRKVLKKTVLFPERIQFIHNVKEHMIKNGFSNMDRYLCTLNGKPYISADGSNYIITEFVDGRECNFDNRNEMMGASRLLAMIHKASRGFKLPEGSFTRDDLGKLPQYFSKRLDEIKKLAKIAKKGKSKFDFMFLDHFEYFYNLGENALQLIESPRYERLVKQSREEGIICHHDFTHHNIIKNGETYYATNFEFCCYELKVYDLANLLRRKMRRCNWDIDEAKLIIDEYRTVESLSEDEIYVMKIMLQFPQKLWRVANKYYNSKRSWSEKSYVAKMQEVIDEIEYHKKFMEQYDMLF